MQSAVATSNSYFVSGGLIFVRENRPITIEKAEQYRLIHLSNISRWMEQTHLSAAARIGMAKIEQGLADELGAAIRSVSTTAANDSGLAPGVAA